MKVLQTVFRQLEEVRAETLWRRDDLTQDELEWHPPAADGEENWSLGEVRMHLTIPQGKPEEA